MKKLYTNYKFIIIIVLLGFVLVYRYYFNDVSKVIDIPGPKGEEARRLIEYDEFCTLKDIDTDLENVFAMRDYQCSIVKYKTKGPIPEGQQGVVEVYTQDFEEGKAKFRDVLIQHNLEESDKLRITYEHKPK